MMKNYTLAKKNLVAAVLLLAMIFLTLYLNIAALIYPFFDLHYPLTSLSHLLNPTEVYNFYGFINFTDKIKLHSSSKLFILFSIIFPFLKLILLYIICFMVRKAEIRYWGITVVQFFDKWALICVFTFLILFFTGNTKSLGEIVPRAGIYYFVLAIFVGIMTSMFANYLCDRTDYQNIRSSVRFIAFRKNKIFVIEKAIIIFVLSIAFFFYILSMIGNYIYVSIGYTEVNHFSIISSWISIQKLSSFFAFFSAVTLIVVPFVLLNDLFLFWATSYHCNFHFKITRLIKNLSRFMMLDVFCVAMILFYIEGKALLKPENRPGIQILILFIFLTVLLPCLVKLYCFLRYCQRLLKKR